MKKLIAAILACTLLTGCFSPSTEMPTVMTTDMTEVTTPPTTEPYGYGMATVSAAELDIYSGPGTEYAISDQIPYGTRIRIAEIQLTVDAVWGRYKNGWLCMDHVTLDDPSGFPMDKIDRRPSLTLSEETVIYSGPGIYYPACSTRSLNSVIDVYGKAGQWYRSDWGWVHKDDLYIYGTTTEAAPLRVTVAISYLLVYFHPDADAIALRYVTKDQELEILFRVTIDGIDWGCIEDGWVRMDQVR